MPDGHLPKGPMVVDIQRFESRKRKVDEMAQLKGRAVLEQLKSGPGSNSTTVTDWFNLAWQQIATSVTNYARAYQVECSLPAVQSDVGIVRPPFDQVSSLLASVSGLQDALAASMTDPSHSNLQKLQLRYCVL